VQTFLSALKEGDKVVTSGGIYGTITRVGEQALQLQIAERVRIEVSRNAIVGYQGQEPVAPEGSGSSS
jgi:preprotein translocase subunit YajC